MKSQLILALLLIPVCVAFIIFNGRLSKMNQTPPPKSWELHQGKVKAIEYQGWTRMKVRNIGGSPK